MAKNNQHDLAIIGGGPAGYAAALYGASAGLDVGLVEKDKLGGTCLNVGCIPAKELLESAAVFQTVLESSQFGVKSGAPTIDMKEVQARKQQVVSKLLTGLSGTLASRDITVYEGVGSLLDAQNIEVEGATKIQANHILLAAGSKPRHLPDSTGLKVDGKSVVTSDEILSWEEIPPKVAIVGAGAIGVEFASFFSDIGSEVLLVDVLPSILFDIDKDIVRVLEKSFAKRGIKIATDVSVTGYENGLLKFADNKAGDGKDESGEFETDLVVVSVGRRPYADELGLKGTGVELNNAGFVKVNESLETKVAGVYAAGDLINTPQLAHTGFAEGIFVVKHLLGEAPVPIDYEKVPWGIYCQPEVAFAGLTEAAAKKEGYEVAVSKHSFAANGRAQILGKTDGLVKVVAEKETGKLLGIHMVGPWVTEQLGAGYLAVNWEAQAADVAEFVFPHPTLSEMFSEAAISLTGRSLHA